MSGRILVIGSLNMDIVYRMKQMPVKGQTVLADDFSYSAGGKGANQACAVGKLGGKVSMLGCVGRDGFGTSLLKSLAESGVDTDNIAVSDEKSTGTASIYVDASGENSIVVNQGANALCSVDYLKQNDTVVAAADFILLQMEIPQDAVGYAVRRCRELGKKVILNPAPAPEKLDPELLRSVDYLTPNETELARISGKATGTDAEIAEAAGCLRNAGLRNLLVTLGEKGCRCFSGTDTASVPACRYGKAIDTTAAGDCFNGAFAVALSEGKDTEEAMRFANAASAIAVSRKGAQSSIPERSEADRLLAEV